MKNILLVCAAGMSTSLLVNKMKDAAKAKGVEININALPVSECSSVVDIFLQVYILLQQVLLMILHLYPLITLFQ